MRHHVPFGLLMVVTLAAFAPSTSFAAKKPAIPAVRWDEERSGCTFSRGDDGKDRYGLWSEDVGIVLAVDSLELQKVHHRHEPFFGVLLNIRYRGPGTLDVPTDNISLEFVKHSRVNQTSLDPDAFAEKVQNDADELDHQTSREIEKHPERKDARQTYMRAFEKDAAELQEFLGRDSLRPSRLNSGNPEVTGWVLFSTESKWIGGWKKQEEFVLRVPLDGKVFEFPFKLPPKPGEAMLRKRE